MVSKGINLADPRVISEQEYYENTGCHGTSIHNAMPSFSIEDIQEFLIKHGYFPFFHEFKSTGRLYDNRTYTEVRKGLFAAKAEVIVNLPNVLSEEEADRHDAIKLFKKLIKEKLLS
jgi:hypothetical protein